MALNDSNNDRKNIIEKAKELLEQQKREGKEITSKDITTALSIAAFSVAGIVAPSILLGKALAKYYISKDKGSSSQVDEDKVEPIDIFGDDADKETEYVITYDYTNMYDFLPENNKEKRLEAGEFIEVDLSTESYMTSIIVNGESIWEPTNQPQDSDDRKWVKYEYFSEADNQTKHTYVQSQCLDKYKPHSIIGNINVKLRGQPIVKADNIFDSITAKDVCYVDTSKTYSFSNGQAVAMENGGASSDGHSWRKVIVKRTNTDGSVRYVEGFVASELLQEIQGVKAICEVTTRTFARSYPQITEYEDIYIKGKVTKGTKVNVVKTIDNNGETWLECKDEFGKTFYIADYSAKEASELSSEIPATTTVTPVATTIPATSTTMSSMTTTNTSNMATTTTETTNTSGLRPLDERQRKAVQDTQVIDDELVFALDLSTYTNLDVYKATIDQLKKDGKIGAVLFEIGTTRQILPFGLSRMGDDAELQKGCNEIQQKMNNSTLFNEGKNFGTFANFIEYVKYAVSNGLAIGFYDYTGPITPQEASACAANVYNIMHRIETELGDEYKKAMVLPFVIDIETMNDARNDAGKQKSGVFVDVNGTRVELNKRENACVELVKLLGHGTDNPECFGILGVDPRDGYHIYDNNYVIYGDISSSIDDFVTIENIEAALPEYHMFNWMTRSIIGASALEKRLTLENYNAEGLFDPKKLVEYFKGNRHISSTGRKGYLANRSEMLQYGLEGLTINGYGFDLNVTTKRNLYALCGMIEYEDQDNFIADLNQIVNGNNKKEVVFNDDDGNR